jgi:hypothetical protein
LDDDTDEEGTVPYKVRPQLEQIVVLRSIGRRYCQCQIDLDGGRTSLFPIPIDHTGSNNIDEANNDATTDSGNEFGWVTYLYWITGFIRYQVDRKLHGTGRRRHSLRTLELSIAQGCESVSAT